MNRVICDIETDSLTPTIIWCIVCYNVDTKEKRVFTPDNLHTFREYAQSVDTWIGHNFIYFDGPAINKVLGYCIDLHKVIDTLVLVRLQDSQRDNSLDAWGARLGYAKLDFSSFDEYSEEMLKYCKRDVTITYLLWKHLESFYEDTALKASIKLEHLSQVMCRELHDTGFPFDMDTCMCYLKDIQEEIAKVELEIRKELKDRVKLVREINPELTLRGTLHKKDFRWTDDLTPYEPECPFSLITFEPFNLGSSRQKVELLNAAGWKPFEKTKGHQKAYRKFENGEITQEKLEEFQKYGWVLSEANLATLPDDAPDALKLLIKWTMLTSRLAVLDGFIAAYNPQTRRIHGSFRSIGAWTHRMAHSDPNLANIPSVGSPYGAEFRALFTSGDGWLVGCDADGIQLRILAHLIADDVFTNALVSGKKEDGTDAHSLNKKALGDVCVSRDAAKTFIYAWLLGAAAARIASILNCSNSAAKKAAKAFEEFYPGLAKLKRQRIPAEVKRGYITGLDGRRIPCPSQHLGLAGHLQGGEAVVMKLARHLWTQELNTMRINYELVNFVHDEWQTIVYGSYEQAVMVGEVQSKAIEQAGVILKLNCPLAGTYKIGKNWKETH